MTVSTRNSDFNLSDEEKKALAVFSQLCAEAPSADLTNEDIRNDIRDEASLIRFLRARKWDPHGAFQQFQAAHQFRKDKRTSDVHDGVRVSDFTKACRIFPHWTGRRDKRGHPICISDVANLTKPTIAAWQDMLYLPPGGGNDDKLQLTGMDQLQLAGVIFDSMTRFVVPLCAALGSGKGEPITSLVILCDASSLTLMQGFDMRVFARDMSELLATCYPETIDKIFICNTPSYFGMIWKVIKGWLDPATAAKLVFLAPHEVFPALEQHIDSHNIPATLGGTHKFEHGMEPDLDAEIRRTLRCESLSPGPWKLLQDSGGQQRVVGVGSVDGTRRMDEVAVFDRK